MISNLLEKLHWLKNDFKNKKKQCTLFESDFNRRQFPKTLYTMSVAFVAALSSSGIRFYPFSKTNSKSK